MDSVEREFETRDKHISSLEAKLIKSEADLATANDVIKGQRIEIVQALSLQKTLLNRLTLTTLARGCAHQCKPTLLIPTTIQGMLVMAVYRLRHKHNIGNVCLQNKLYKRGILVMPYAMSFDQLSL